MTAPAYVYAYEVVSSDHPNIPVGKHLADKGRALAPVWEFYDTASGDLLTVVGKRGKRLCSECWVDRKRHHKVLDHGHDGPHGQGEDA